MTEVIEVKKTPAHYRFLVKSDPEKYKEHLEYQRKYREEHRSTPAKVRQPPKIWNENGICFRCKSHRPMTDVDVQNMALNKLMGINT